jgi:hypothetical protein
MIWCKTGATRVHLVTNHLAGWLICHVRHGAGRARAVRAPSAISDSLPLAPAGVIAAWLATGWLPESA